MVSSCFHYSGHSLLPKQLPPTFFLSSYLYKTAPSPSQAPCFFLQAAGPLTLRHLLAPGAHLPPCSLRVFINLITFRSFFFFSQILAEKHPSNAIIPSAHLLCFPSEHHHRRIKHLPTLLYHLRFTSVPIKLAGNHHPLDSQQLTSCSSCSSLDEDSTSTTPSQLVVLSFLITFITTCSSFTSSGRRSTAYSHFRSTKLAVSLAIFIGQWSLSLLLSRISPPFLVVFRFCCPFLPRAAAFPCFSSPVRCASHSG